ncbi:Spore protein SP21 [Maioricimonas rarisocia]|uniref:Spore protein SP21 n=1 Tax=Maioricimonas rarisocia TaxID=2528026 RepID=A0A517Z8B4_9PLAN|nr:Hsp20/alpha crystallin family protein [Maioricimonas rarisocia]QDU38718.1 Spore protein SP21 [Maioricimonas rarisocia]
MELFPWKSIRLSLLDADRQIDDAFNHFIGGMCGGQESQPLWSPELDVFESDDAYVIEADLPGVPPEQLQVEVEDDIVTICGSRASRREQKSVRGVWIERRQGSFCRRLQLDHPVDADQITITQQQGTYSIRLPKRQTNDSGAEPETAHESA